MESVECREAVEVGDAGNFLEVLDIWVEKLSTEQREWCFFMLWSLWCRRNRLVFENEHQTDYYYLANVSRVVSEYNEFYKKIYGVKIIPPRPAISSQGTLPPEGLTKINVDASTASEGWISLSAVARDSQGRVSFAAVRRLRARWSPLVAECRAALFGLKKAKALCLTHLIIESDCQNLIDKVKNNKNEVVETDFLLQDILRMSSQFDMLVWSQVNRNGNKAAHHLARVVPFGLEQCLMLNAPSEISQFVFSDLVSASYY